MFARLFILFLLFCSTISVYGQGQNFSDLQMTVHVLGTEVEKRTDVEVIKVLLRLEFINDSDRKILLINKYSLNWGKDILRSESGEVIYHQAGGNSFFQRDKVRTHLLSLELPSSEVRELNPGEMFDFEDFINVLIYQKDDGLGGSKILKGDVKELDSVWLKLRHRFWDPNLDLELMTMKKLGFGTQLRNKWKPFGVLWTAPIEAAPVKIVLPALEK